ncbi:hypothetical protein A2W24_07110 [Microgenomates group bacterium RBG_16_45_19]|nr:MAG: hypothetical protein A2W24_07110 [Microgenomates group bacterium RBG_16_45_19]
MAEDGHQLYLRVGRRRWPLTLIRNGLMGVTLVVLGAGLGYAWAFKQINQTQIPSVLKAWRQAPEQMKLDKDGLDFSLYWQVWETLEKNFLETEKIDPKEMVYGSIQGMTAALGDPYTVFLPPEENQQTKEDLNGEFDGIGVQLGYKRDTLAVMAPLEGHPAIKQGVKAGDLILHIKDEQKQLDVETAGLTLPEAVTMIRGKKGTPVTLTLYREDKGTFEVTIMRETIAIPSVEWEYGEVTDKGWVKQTNGTIAWLKLRRFGEKTQPEWDEAVADIVKHRDNLKGVVLDLRNNPGGYLTGAIDLASDFIPEGVVVQQQGRAETQTFKVTRRARLINLPTVVVINGGSASASEILAGALRDRLQVKLVGERSFGKGTVQEAIELADQAGLHVTTARWLLPNGDWIHEDGLKPDVEVTLPDEVASEAANLKDSQLEAAVKELTN